MTKNKSKKLCVDHMTPEYFYPDVINGSLEELRVPTVFDLKFVGVTNVEEIRHYFRGEEEKLRKAHTKILWTINNLSKEAAKVTTNQYEVKCDWQGLTVESQSAFSCRFGKEVAEWCGMNPKNCRCILCIKRNPISGAVEKCQHYELCHYTLLHNSKELPLHENPCVFCYDKDGEMLKRCRDFLQVKADDYASRRSFVEKYINNLTAALKDRNNKKPPFFDLSTTQYLAQVENNSEILEFVHKDDGSIDIRRGLFIAKIRDCYEDVFVLNMYDGEMVKIPTVRFSRHTERMFMTMEDLNYLLSHNDYCRVWLRFHPIIGRQLSADDFVNIFTKFGVVSELISKMQ